MKNIFRAAAVFLMLFAVSGCGQTVKQSVAPVDSTSVSNPLDPDKRLAVLPFADYSKGDRPDEFLRRQIKLQSSMVHNLNGYGFVTPVHEDVIQFLVEKGIIKTSDSTGSRYADGLMSEMGRGWSEEMQREITQIIALNEARNGRNTQDQQTVGFNKDILKELGNYFGVNYALRGRIVEYEMRDEHTLNPFRRGFLPFFYDSSSAAFFGIAKSEDYDLWQDMAVGGIFGGVIGNNLDTPFNPPTEHTETVVSGGPHPAFITMVTNSFTEGGFSDYAGLNTAVWGSAGAAAAYLAKKGGAMPQAVVQVQLAVQDLSDGHVVWSNRAEVQVASESAWADSKHRTLMDRAIEEASKVLMADFARYSPRLAWGRQVSDSAPVFMPMQFSQEPALSVPALAERKAQERKVPQK